MTERRYWVSAPIALLESSMEDQVPEEEAEQLATIDGELADLGFFRDDENVQWIYKTRDLDEAREMAIEAKKAWSRPSDPVGADGISITAQPECPRCGRLGRFSDQFCAACGAKMLPAVDIDPDTGGELRRR